jgi:uncharacterized protein
MTGNPAGWFEIPVIDMQRAKAFYKKAFELEFEMLEIDACQMAMFPFKHEQPGCSGALVKGEPYKPVEDGIVLYFQCAEVSERLDKIRVAGGVVLRDKMSIGEHGFIGLFKDSEGNRLGLHSGR